MNLEKKAKRKPDGSHGKKRASTVAGAGKKDRPTRKAQSSEGEKSVSTNQTVYAGRR